MTKGCGFFPHQTAVVVGARMQLAFLSEKRDYTDQNVIGSCKWCMSTHFIFLSEGDCVTAAGLVSVNNGSQYLNTLQHAQESKKCLGLLTVGLCVALVIQASQAGLWPHDTVQCCVGLQARVLRRGGSVGVVFAQLRKAKSILSIKSCAL